MSDLIFVAGRPPGGTKADTGKTRWELLPADALDQVAQVMTFGAAKYGDRNWEKGFVWSRLFGALMRHSWAWMRGEAADPDTGLSHMAHAACCALFLISHEMRGLGSDDRPGAQAR